LGTTQYSFDDEITTADEFEAVLGQLLLVALDNDVDIWGAWEYRSNDGTADLEAMVVELRDRTEE